MKSLRIFILLLILIVISRSAAASESTLTSKNISYQDWGTYYTTWYDYKTYFAGYSKGPISEEAIFTFNTTSKSGQLHSVLKDENIDHQFKNGDQIPLQDGYFLQINDIDVIAGNVLVTLMKNGSEIESKIIGEGENYIFLKNIGNISDLPIIAVHLENVISGPLIFINGVFQISEDYVFISSSQTPTPTPTVTPVCLKIDGPVELIQLRMATVKITYYGMPVSKTRVYYDGNVIGETDNNGSIEFVLDTSGIHTITASKTGYNNGSKIITVVEPEPTAKQTPASTDIQTTPNTATLPAATDYDMQEIAVNANPLNNETDSKYIIDPKKIIDNILTGIYPAFIVALILIVIIVASKLRKRV